MSVFYSLDVAIGDFSDIANKIASKDTQGQWEFSEFRRTYDGGVEDQDSFQCDSILVYCNGDLVEDGSRAALAVIYYVGVSLIVHRHKPKTYLTLRSQVYYKTLSETKATRDLVHKSAFSTAQQLGVSSYQCRQTPELIVCRLLRAGTYLSHTNTREYSGYFCEGQIRISFRL